MCGICGAIDWRSAGNAEAIVRRMNPAMVHRGPDDEGYMSHGRLSVGIRRLSIIDIAGGHQPIFNQDQTVGVVLNGEIYNFRELGKQLQDRGHTLHTRSDSEVVAHAYEEWGPECVERLEGMFAIAISDRRDSSDPKLFLARDRFGIKPLYYHASPERFLFASEVRTLLASEAVPRKLSRTALESYLLFGSVVEPMTLVEGVSSIPPGHRVTISLNAPNTTIQPECYWNIASRSVNGQTVKAKGAPAEVRELLSASVRKHLIADVPVGVFLSSGIDSTALAALASREVSGVHTFTVAFPEEEFSEAAIARRTAEKFRTTHQEVMLSGDDMLRQLPDAVTAIDQPTMDGINTYFVSRSAREAGLKVALSGLGGDEIFGGYNTFWRTTQYQRMAWAGNHFPAKFKSAAASAAGAAGGRFVRGDVSRKISALWNTPESLPDPFYFGRNLFTPTQVSELVDAQRNGHPTPWWDWLATSAAEARQLDSFAAVSCMEARSYMVNTLLRDTDFMSMAHSLEVRVPFLDHPLVEYVMQLAQQIKVRRGRPKALLVDALQDMLPAEVVNQTKRGFTFPWAEWLRGPLKGSVDQGLTDLHPQLEAVMDPEQTQAVWQSYLDNKTSWSRPWSLYVLNEWVKRNL